ncbi:nuclear transport factor 2 family protein [Flagellimonas sp. W118]|uniref:nuclear transport factor 2 family protein n=1 Tax=Flagellimonas sp. W118 TaxID=3410791 RepID=UPI003BF5EE6C
MKLSRLIIIVLGLCLANCQTKRSSEPEKLAISIEKFNTAFAEGNLEVLDAMTTENYLHTNSSSRVIGKTDWFNYLKKRNKDLKSGAIEVLQYELDETKIEHHGNSALVTGRVTVVARDSMGTKKNQYRITNIWVYENGTWKRAGFHDGRIE